MIEKDFDGQKILVMSVADLKNRLSQLPDDLELSDREFDSEWGYTYLFGIAGVENDGYIRRTMIGSIDYSDEYPLEEEDE